MPQLCGIEMDKNTFILSDLSINCYGFVLMTSGIDLTAFKKNPVMLYNHNASDLDTVIGNWQNVRIEGTELKAETNFDTEDDFAKRVANKVQKGFLKGASVGFDFQPEHVMFDVPGYEGVPVITKSLLFEASITPTPGNNNAIKLYKNRELITNEELATALLNNQQTINLNNKMKKIIVLMGALGVTLSADASEEHVVEAVKKIADDKKLLEGKLSKLEADHEALKTQLSNEQENSVKVLVADAQKAGKIAADQVDHFTKLAKSDFASTKSIIDSMTPHKTISSQLNKDADESEGGDPYAKWDFKKLQKEAPAELLKIKNTDKDRYRKLYKQAYPNAVFND